ncbi:hypothetical protein M758_UG142800 [Ceratodon purpureus]|nr:hypothetical protein M758_UG142800 [Ceratodon purpureus]
MTVESMVKVERRYSRKVGESFRRDKEHLALFEELANHDDLDSSLAALEFVASAQGGIGDDVLELDGNKSEDDWLVTIPEVHFSLNPGQRKVVTNDSLSSIRTSRKIASDVDLAMLAPRRNASPTRRDSKILERFSISTSKSPRPGSISTSKSPRPVFSTSTKSPRPSTASFNSRGSSSPRSVSTTKSSGSPRLPIRSSSPSTTRSSSASRATIATTAKSAGAFKSSSPTFTRASTINSPSGRRASTGTQSNRPLLASNAATTSTSAGVTKTFVRGSSPSARGSSPARTGTGWSPTPSVYSTNSRGNSPGRAGFHRGPSPSKSNNLTSRGSSPARSVSSTANRKPSPSRRNSSPATPEISSVTTSKGISIARKACTPESVEKPSGSFYDLLLETPANLRTSSFNRGSSSPGSVRSKSYDDPSNERRRSSSSQDFDSYLSKSQDRGSGYLSGSRGSTPNRELSRSHDGGSKSLSKSSSDRLSPPSGDTSVGDFNSQPYLNPRVNTGDHRILSRNVTVSEYGLDGRRISKGNKEMPSSPKVGHSLGRSTTLQQDPAFESSLMRRVSDRTASRSVGYNTLSSGGGFIPFMTNNSILSFNTSISSSLHRKLHQTDGQPQAASPHNEKREDTALAAIKDSSPHGTEESCHVDHKNTVKRTQMGSGLKKEDVTPTNHTWAGTSENEAKLNRTEMGSKSPRLTALVVSQGPVKIYQGLGDMEDMGANWCCGMEYQYRSFCKQHDCGIYKNFHDALVVSNSKFTPASKKNADEGKDLDSESVVADTPTADVRKCAGPTSDSRAFEFKNEESGELVCDAMNVEMDSADLVVKSRIQQPKCRQLSSEKANLNSSEHSQDANESKYLKSSREETLENKSGPFVIDAAVGGAGRRMSPKEGFVQEKISPDPEIITMSSVSVCESETSDEMLPLHELSPTPLAVGNKNRQLECEKAEAVIKNDLIWELDTLESSSRPLKPPDFFAVTKRHGVGAAISRVQSFNASEYDAEETRSIKDARKTKNPYHLYAGANEVYPSKSDSDEATSPKTTEVGANEMPESRPVMERAMNKRSAQRVEGVENVQVQGSPHLRETGSDLEEDNPRAPLRHVADDSNVSLPEQSHIIPLKPAKLFPFANSPKDGFGGGNYKKGDVLLMSSTKSAGSRVSSTSATSIDLTRSVDTTCSAHSQYDNALWDDPNYSGRFGDPMAGIPFKSIATLPLPLPAEVRCMELPGAVIPSSREGGSAPDSEIKTPRYNDGLEKLAGYMRSASLNARKRRPSNGPSSEGESKMHSRESSFDYFVDFLDSQPDLDLDKYGLTDVLVSAHKEAKKLENSPGANNNLRFIKRLDSRLSNNSLISDKSYESRVTDMSSDSSWESGKNRTQPSDGACQVMEQIVENANALSHGRHLSSFKFGQKKTPAISDLEAGSESPPDLEHVPSPARRPRHQKQISHATSDSSQKSAKHYDERFPDGRVLPALKSTPGIIIMCDKSPDDPKFGLNSPPRLSSNNDIGEFDGNLWEAVQIMEEEQEMEADLTPPDPIEFAVRDFTSARTPARTPSRTPARTPSHASKASSNDSHYSHHSHNSHHSHRSHNSQASSVMGMTRSPSVASKLSSKHLESSSDDGETSAERADFGSRHAHRSHCGCTIL